MPIPYVHTCTHKSVTTDEYGSKTYSSGTQLDCFLDMGTRVVYKKGEEYTHARGVIFLPASQLNNISKGDIIEVDSENYTVVDVQVLRTVRGVHHIELVIE